MAVSAAEPTGQHLWLRRRAPQGHPVSSAPRATAERPRDLASNRSSAGFRSLFNHL